MAFLTKTDLCRGLIEGRWECPFKEHAGDDTQVIDGVEFSGMSTLFSRKVRVDLQLQDQLSSLGQFQIRFQIVRKRKIENGFFDKCCTGGRISRFAHHTSRRWELIAFLVAVNQAVLREVDFDFWIVLKP